MAGSVFGTLFRVSTWGESHGLGIGVVVDGCPASLPLWESCIQKDLDRRKPGQSVFTTKRAEDDRVEILSGVFEGVTTGTPISMLIRNQDQRSKDYGPIAEIFRPGHADYGYHCKYGLRDYRGGGRSSGRETAGRVAAGAVAKKILQQLGVSIMAYTHSIGHIGITNFNPEEIMQNPLSMPDKDAYAKAASYVQACVENKDSVGGVVECVVKGLPPGIGEPVFDKLDALLSHAIMSIGGVKGIEFGAGFAAAASKGSLNNDPFFCEGQNTVQKQTNHAGGVLGGMSDGDSLVLRAAFKPTPSIGCEQQTVNQRGENVTVNIQGRHDPLIVPRAVVVVEAMTAIALADLMMINAVSRIDSLKKVYSR